MTDTQLIALATWLGARPFLVISALVTLLIVALLAMVMVGRLASAYAGAVWRVAAELWDRLQLLPPVRWLQQRFPALWRIIGRLTATEYLLLHLGLGLTLAFAALGFVSIAEAVTGDELIVQVDLAFATALHETATPRGVQFFRFYTFWGGWIPLGALGVLVAAYLLRAGHRVLATGWVTAVIGAGLLNVALKMWFERPRPSFAEPIAVSAGWSFPSGHAMGTFVTIGMLAYLLVLARRTARWRIVTVALALLVIVLMGFSRMYLGVHYLSDVAAGFAAGTVWLAGCISGVEIARPRGSGRRVSPAP